MQHRRKHQSRRQVVGNIDKTAPIAASAANAPVKTCERCGKACYASRRKAKARGRVLYPGHHMSAYPCGDMWHVGNLPSLVVDGGLDRAELRSRR